MMTLIDLCTCPASTCPVHTQPIPGLQELFRGLQPEPRIACIVIATERRRTQVWNRVVPSAQKQFDEVIVVGDWPSSDGDHEGVWDAGGNVRYTCVAPLTRSTTDALIKRDVGTLMTACPVVAYLCDDHALAPGFGDALRAVLDEPWDVLVPNRCCTASGMFAATAPMEPLNNGEREAYCGGHAGVFRREVVAAKPWSAHAHHRNWDVLVSHEQQARGARFVWSPRAEITVVDLEPENRPWL